MEVAFTAFVAQHGYTRAEMITHGQACYEAGKSAHALIDPHRKVGE